MSSFNARLLEKDIMSDLTAVGGDSEIVDLNGAIKFSCQAVYDVSAPGNKTFDSGVAALLVVQDLTYTADLRGTAGNSITIAYTSGGTAGTEVVTVVGTAISVQIQSGVSTGTQVKTAVDASVAASALISVAISGTGSNAQVTAAVTPLASGVASEVNTTSNTILLDASAYPTGLKVRLTTTGTLPAPLATGTDYFIIYVDDATIQLATTLDNAVAGTAIDLTTQGSSAAVATVVVTALAGATVTFQKSNDATNWLDIQAATSVTIDGSTLLVQPDVSYRYFKVVKALTAGTFDLDCYTLVIGPAV